METYCFCNLKQLVGLSVMVYFEPTGWLVKQSRLEEAPLNLYCSLCRIPRWVLPRARVSGTWNCDREGRLCLAYFIIKMFIIVIICHVSRLSELCHLRLVFTALPLFSGLQPSSVYHPIKNWQFLAIWRDFSWRWQRGPLLRDRALSQLKKYFFFFFFFALTRLSPPSVAASSFCISFKFP